MLRHLVLFSVFCIRNPKRRFPIARCAHNPDGCPGLHKLEYRENCSAGGIHGPLHSGYGASRRVTNLSVVGRFGCDCLLRIPASMQTDSSSTKSSQSNQESLSSAINSAGVGTWDWNIESGELVWSDRNREMFGLPRGSEVTYEAFLQALHPDDRERIDLAVKKTLEKGEKYDVEMRAVWPDGSIHWNASRGQAYFDGTGRPVRMSGIAIDITRLKEAEEELKRTRGEAKAQADNFAALLDAVPALAFFSQDPKCEHMIASHYAHEVFSLPSGKSVSTVGSRRREAERPFVGRGRRLRRRELPMQQARPPPAASFATRNWKSAIRMATDPDSGQRCSAF